MIFPRPELESFGFDVALGEEETLRGLDRLAHLQHLHRAGYWSRLKESNVEQSFVERVFGDVFGYTTLLSGDRQDEPPQLMPKLYVPLLNSGKAFPDFALGHFRADQQLTVVTAELKSPGADLDAPQGGQYKGQTPVQQAMQAAYAAGAEWCVVSNTGEIRLYRVPDLTQYEMQDLLNIVSPLEFRRAYALFSRRSLLAVRHGERSPLSRLYAHHVAGESMIVPSRPGRVRLVQRLRPRGLRQEFAFTRLSQHLEKALTTVPSINVMSGEFLRPKLQDDQLVFQRESGGEVWQRIALLKSGLVVCSFPLPLGTETKSPDQPIFIDPAEVAMLLCQMMAFGFAFFQGLHAELVYEWSIEDLSGRAAANDGKKWTRPTPHTRLTCQADVTRTSYPESQQNVNSMKADSIVAILTEVVRELFFPFEGNDIDKKLCRLEPTRNEMKSYLNGIESFKVFP